MVFLRRPKLRGSRNFSDHAALETDRFGADVGLALIEQRLRLFRQFFLLRIVEKNAGAVLLAHVAELLIFARGVDVLPEHFKQFGVADLLRVKHNFDGLGMRGCTGRHLLVSRAFFFAADVARSGGNDTIQLVKRRFHAPEAAASKGGFGQARWRRRRLLGFRRRSAAPERGKY